MEKTVGSGHFDTSAALLGLANLYMETAAYERAELFYKRALAIRERASGANSIEVAAVFNGMGSLYRYMGMYSRAKTFYRRALAIREKANGNEHPETARVLANLAMIDCDTGDYAEAEFLFRRALRIQEGRLGIEHPNTGRTLHNLATLYVDIGAPSQAEPLLRRLVAIRRKAQSAARGDLSLSLDALGAMYSAMGHYAQAKPLCEEALAIAKQVFGKKHPYTLIISRNLGGLYRRSGDYRKSELLLKQSIDLSTATLGPEDLETANLIGSLALLYAQTGAYHKAESLYQHAVQIYEKTVGLEYPSSLNALRSLAMLHWIQGESHQALALLQQAQRIHTKNVDRFLATGFEERKQAYLQKLTEDTFDDISFAMSTPGIAATVLSLTSVLRHKGRVLDAMTDSMTRLRRSIAPADLALLEQLEDVASQLSTSTYGRGESSSSAEYRQRLAQLSASQEQLQVELAGRSRTFKRELTPITIANVQQAIPSNAVLLEWFRYRPSDPKRKSFTVRRGPPRYVAYVLKHTGEPTAIDMGPAYAIDALAHHLRAALIDPTNKDFKQHAAALSAKLLAPLRTHLQGIEHILFSPDGELNLVPIAALLDESGAYLIQRFDVSYLTSGRDLLRFADQPAARTGPIVMANPDYGKVKVSAAGDTISPARHSSERGGLIFRALAGTALEAQDLKKLLKLDDSSLLLGQDASEAQLKRLKGPRILHIASHGFFLSNQQLTQVMLERSGASSALPGPTESPLLRSGIALAGANQHSSGSDDGILTALEATRLDLSGTELVVLSACDSAVGEVQNGEGVYGLRRALALAGAQTQVTSLWKVSDEATRSLIVDYYQRLLNGEGRSAALRNAQRAMLTNPVFSHPYYWASFIAIGNWNSLATPGRK